MMATYIDENQYHFERNLRVLGIAARFLLKAIVYLPLWFTGYILTENILEGGDSALARIGLIVLFAIVLYQLLFFIKGIIIGLKFRNNLLWIPLFIICTAFTCIIPVWATLELIRPLMNDVSKNSAELLSWIAALAFGIWIYTRYHFLRNIAPVAAFWTYQLGIDLSFKLMNLAMKLKAGRSASVI